MSNAFNLSLALVLYNSLLYTLMRYINKFIYLSIYVFINLSLVCLPRGRSSHRPMDLGDCNADVAAPRHVRISVLQVSDSSIMDPKECQRVIEQYHLFDDSHHC